MIRIAICDDNIELVERIRGICLDYEKKTLERLSIECFTKPLDFIHSHNKFDVIFMDIEMPEVDGITASKIFREIDKEAFIIFVSGYEKYKPVAFGVHPFDYIDKPFSKDDIFRVLHDVLQYMSKNSYPNNITVRIGNESHVISTVKIRYIELVDRKIKIYYEDEIIIIYETVSSLYAKLQGYGFLMPHSAFLINYRFIKTFKRYEILLIDGTEVPISHKKYNDFEKSFHTILCNQNQGRRL